jgi:hypothetical protein
VLSAEETASTGHCDDGNNVDSDGCSSSSGKTTNDCKLTTGWSNPTLNSAAVPIADDGLVVGVEVCDDGQAFV